MALSSIGSFAACNPRLSSIPGSTQRTVITCSRPVTRIAAGKGVCSVCEPLPPDRPLWYPGSTSPEWPDGSLPGDFGFDPLGLAEHSTTSASNLLHWSDPELLQWFPQAELMHSRWAMLAVAGILIPEGLQRLEFIDDFSWYEAGEREYFADPVTLFVVQMALMGWVEGRRSADFVNPGSVEIEPKFPNRKKSKPDVGYPDGLWFDSFMWGRGSPDPVMVLRTRRSRMAGILLLLKTFLTWWITLWSKFGKGRRR